MSLNISEVVAAFDKVDTAIVTVLDEVEKFDGFLPESLQGAVAEAQKAAAFLKTLLDAVS